MLEQNSTSIFPLTLTPFEHYFLADDRFDYPMNTWVCTIFIGKMNRQLFEKSLDLALARAPLLQALVDGEPDQKTSEIFWIDSHGKHPYIDWVAGDAPLNFPNGLRIDLRKEVGLRCFIREGLETTKIYFQLHHSCCDGFGFLEFFEDLLMAYHLQNSSRDTVTIFSKVDKKLLQDRNKYKLSWKQRLEMFPQEVKISFKYLFPRGQPLALPNETASCRPEELHPPFIQSFVFSREETKQIENVSKREGVTLNDLLLRDLFLSLNEWNKKYDSTRKTNLITIGVPINYRHLLNDFPHAVNAIGIIPLTKKITSLTSATNLLRLIHEDIGKIKAKNIVLTSQKILRLIGKIRGVLNWYLKEEHCISSSLLTNLMELMRNSKLPRAEGKLIAGNVKLEKIEVIPAIRPKTYACFLALTYADQLNICVHCDPKKIGIKGAKEILGMYVDRIRQSLNRD